MEEEQVQAEQVQAAVARPDTSQLDPLCATELAGVYLHVEGILALRRRLEDASENRDGGGTSLEGNLARAVEDANSKLSDPNID